MSTPPPTYENYPPARDAGARATDGAGPEQPHPPLVAPPPPPAPPPGPGRRTVVRLIGGSVAALVGVAIIRNNLDPSGGRDPAGWSTGGAPAEEEDDEDTPENELGVGDYTVSWPDGWSVDDSTDVQAVLVKGGATAIFRAYAPGDDVTAGEEARRLLNRHTAGLGKRRTGTPSTASGSSESASIEASGTRGDGVRVDVHVWVAIGSDPDRDALAVIALLPSGTSTKVRTEITRMRRTFLDQLA